MNNANDIFNIVEWLEEAVARDTKLLADIGNCEKSLWGRRPMFVVQSLTCGDFVGEINRSGNYGMRFNAVECRIFCSRKEAEQMAEAFADADIECEVVDYRETLNAEMKRLRNSIPETKKALLQAIEDEVAA